MRYSIWPNVAEVHGPVPANCRREVHHAHPKPCTRWTFRLNRICSSTIALTPLSSGSKIYLILGALAVYLVTTSVLIMACPSGHLVNNRRLSPLPPIIGEESPITILAKMEPD